jgi:hypothetical protein
VTHVSQTQEGPTDKRSVLSLFCCSEQSDQWWIGILKIIYGMHGQEDVCSNLEQDLEDQRSKTAHSKLGKLVHGKGGTQTLTTPPIFYKVSRIQPHPSPVAEESMWETKSQVEDCLMIRELEQKFNSTWGVDRNSPVGPAFGNTHFDSSFSKVHVYVFSQKMLT